MISFIILKANDYHGVFRFELFAILRIPGCVRAFACFLSEISKEIDAADDNVFGCDALLPAIKISSITLNPCLAFLNAAGAGHKAGRKSRIVCS